MDSSSCTFLHDEYTACVTQERFPICNINFPVLQWDRWTTVVRREVLNSIRIVATAIQSLSSPSTIGRAEDAFKFLSCQNQVSFLTTELKTPADGCT